MYYNYNDYELIYLIKEGVEEALKEMFRKYSHFLYKFYYQQENRFTSKGDFIQEGFMVLQKAIETYDMDKEISFYTYFNICLKRKIPKMHSLKVVLEESHYSIERIRDNQYFSNIMYIILKEVTSEDDELIHLFKWCVVRGMPIKTYCKFFDYEYEKTYYKYKKLIENLRKKVD